MLSVESLDVDVFPQVFPSAADRTPCERRWKAFPGLYGTDLSFDRITTACGGCHRPVPSSCGQPAPQRLGRETARTRAPSAPRAPAALTTPRPGIAPGASSQPPRLPPVSMGISLPVHRLRRPVDTRRVRQESIARCSQGIPVHARTRTVPGSDACRFRVPTPADSSLQLPSLTLALPTGDADDANEPSLAPFAHAAQPSEPELLLLSLPDPDTGEPIIRNSSPGTSLATDIPALRSRSWSPM